LAAIQYGEPLMGMVATTLLVGMLITDTVWLALFAT
jgi:hypothetical protein